MKLCHKCEGTFVIVDGLNSCQCISGYERGFEPNVTFEQAATAQAKREIEWLSLFVSQGRESTDDAWIRTLSRLKIVMKSSPLFGHGIVNWDGLAYEK